MCQARLCFLLIVLPGLVGCILDDARIESNAHMAAFADHESTRIGRQLADLAAANPDKSGFAIIRYGRPALAARVALADLAEHTLDVQYYIWEADATGRILAERLVRAADRGVRVRILVDDINLSGRDARVASLDAHPNIEIRIFNPFANRKFRVLDFAFDLARVNHRMHNKMMIMDNALTLVGGRNVGAHYFQAHTQSNFRDLDIVGAGPIVRDTSEVFDRFWDGPWSVPVAQLVKKAFGQEQLVAAVADMRRQIEADDYPFPLEIDTTELLDDLENIFDNLVWAPGQIVWEDPTSIYEGVQSGRMNEALLERLETLESELLIESAYFVPRETGVAVVRSLTGRGIRVRVLTNSLVANDVLAAHAGYSKYRRPLLESGTELYELRPYPGPVDQKIVSTKSKAGLHTKAIVFDRKDVFIGSFNLDPRSSMINTEAGVSPHNAFRVLLGDNEALHWVIEVAGAHVEYDKDPNSSWYQRWLAGVIRSLPIEDQL
jgi:putative cardiolipin synthase